LKRDSDVRDDPRTSVSNPFLLIQTLQCITVGYTIVSYFSMDSGNILLDLIPRRRIPSKIPKRKLAVYFGT
jgi:hypothetical protein